MDQYAIYYKGLQIGTFNNNEGDQMADKLTINEALVHIDQAQARLAELSALQKEVAKKERFFGTAERSVEPTYDVKAVDKQIVRLRRVVLGLKTAIKQSNAVTEINFKTEQLEEIFRELA